MGVVREETGARGRRVGGDWDEEARGRIRSRKGWDEKLGQRGLGWGVRGRGGTGMGRRLRLGVA